MKIRFLFLSLLLLVGVTAFATNDNDGKKEGVEVKLEVLVSNNILELPSESIDISVKQTEIKLVSVPDCNSTWHDTGNTRCNPITGVYEKEQRRLCCQFTGTTWWCDYQYQWVSMPS